MVYNELIKCIVAATTTSFAAVARRFRQKGVKQNMSMLFKQKGAEH